MQHSLIPVYSRPSVDDDVSLSLSIDELRWLHASEATFDAPTEASTKVCPRGLRTRTRSGQRHRHYHLLDGTPLAIAASTSSSSSSSTATPAPRRPSTSLIPVPARPAAPPVRTEWIYRSPKRPSPRPRTRSTSSRTRPRPPTGYHARPVHSVIPALSAKEKEKEKSIWTMLRLGDGKEEGGSPGSRILDIVNAAENETSKKGKGLALVIGRGRPPTLDPPPRNRASSASSNSTASAHTVSTPATSPSPSVPASPKPPSTAPTKSILSRSASTSSRAGPQRSIAALFTRGTSSGSVSGSVKSVTFVDEPTVHYPDEYTDADSEAEPAPEEKPKSTLGTLELELDEDDFASGLSKGALAWEMGLDIETMDLDLSLELEVAPGVNLDAPLELDIGQKYVPPKREGIGGIIEEDENEDEDAAPLVDKSKSKGAEGLKRLLSLGAGTRTNRRPTRPTISGPFALGSTSPNPPASRSSASLRSQTKPSTTTTHTFPPRSPYPVAPSSAPSTPIHTKPHSYPRRPRTAPSIGNTSPTSTTSSIGLGSPRCAPYVSSLHTAPSLESFRSAAGRSVRSLGSIKSTASARSAFRAFLGKIGIGSSVAVVGEHADE
ncbi:hypothetical protein C0989_001134 [Termitomyces sp. Mn162]|nr:hypothetical protein C0989_001134 [Termitomyces sp. Mn162]